MEREYSANRSFLHLEGSLLTKYPRPAPGLLGSQVMRQLRDTLAVPLSSTWLEMKDLDTMGQKDRGSLESLCREVTV